MDTTQTLLLRVARAVVKNPAFQPQGTTTFCNFGAQLIANAVFGYSGFDGLNANQIHAFLASSPNWTKVDAGEAQFKANGGGLAVCSQVEQGHGHVSVIIPGEMVPSEHFGHPAPLTANVGKVCNIMGANFGFASEPDYFTYNG